MIRAHPTKTIHIGKSHQPINQPKLAKAYIFANAVQYGRKESTCGNSVFVAIAGEVVNQRSVLLRNFVLNGQERASSPLLHIHTIRHEVMRWKFFKIIVLITVILSISDLAHSQQTLQSEVLESTAGNVEFISNAPLELIKASSQSLRGFLNTSERTFAFSVPTASFKGFNSPLQQEHFYENYIESHKFPTATFNGRMIENIDLAGESDYTVRAKGIFEIHGVKSERIIKVNIRNREGIMYAEADFYVMLADHNIIIPRMVYQKIAEKIRVIVEIEFDLNPNR